MPAHAADHFAPTLMTAMARAVVAILAVAALSMPAGAQLGAGAPGRGVTHSWFVLPGEDGTGAVLVHLPPRREAAPGGAARGVDDGTVRSALRLAVMPDAIAAVGDTVYVLTTGASGVRTVGALRAAPAAGGNLWLSYPEDRLLALPAVPGRARIKGFAGTDRGPVVLLEDENAQRELMLLERRQWRRVELPRQLSGAGTEVWLVAGSTGPGLVSGDDAGEWRHWSSVLTPDPPSPDYEPLPSDEELESGQLPSEPEPTVVGASWRDEPVAPPPITGRLGPFLTSGGLLTVVHWGDDGRAAVHVWEAEAWRSSGEFMGATDVRAAAAIDGLGRLVLAWRAPDEPGAPPSGSGALPPPPGARRRIPPTHLEVREVSVWTGRVFHDGQARYQGLITGTEFRALSLAILGVMGAVLFLILRPEPKDNNVLSLPAGVALADPARRCVAMVLDGSLAMALSLKIWGLASTELSDVSLLLSATFLLAVASAAGLGLILGTLSEAMLGRSPGKLVVGCRVIGRRGEEYSKPSLLQALIRNVVKWLLWPAAVLAIWDPNLRHRGDMLARTIVVIDVEPDRPDPPQEG